MTRAKKIQANEVLRLEGVVARRQQKLSEAKRKLDAAKKRAGAVKAA